MQTAACLHPDEGEEEAVIISEERGDSRTLSQDGPAGEQSVFCVLRGAEVRARRQ